MSGQRNYYSKKNDWTFRIEHNVYIKSALWNTPSTPSTVNSNSQSVASTGGNLPLAWLEALRSARYSESELDLMICRNQMSGKTTVTVTRTRRILLLSDSDSVKHEQLLQPGVIKSLGGESQCHESHWQSWCSMPVSRWQPPSQASLTYCLSWSRPSDSALNPPAFQESP